MDANRTMNEMVRDLADRHKKTSTELEALEGVPGKVLTQTEQIQLIALQEDLGTIETDVADLQDSGAFIILDDKPSEANAIEYLRDFITAMDIQNVTHTQIGPYVLFYRTDRREG